MKDIIDRLMTLNKNSKKLEMGLVKRILYTLAIVSMSLVIILYISNLLGKDYFLLDEFKNDFVLDWIISPLLFHISLLSYILFCTNISFNKAIIGVCTHVPIYIICILIKYPYGMITTINCILWVVLAQSSSNFGIKCILKSIGRFTIYLILMTLFGYFVASLKFGSFNFLSFYYVSPISKLLYSLDSYLFGAVLIIIRRNKNYALERVLFAENVKRNSLDDEDLELIEQFKQQSRGRKLIGLSKLALLQVIQLSFILTVSYFGSVLIECIFVLVSYFIFRILIRELWHSKSIAICTICSTLLFYIASRVTIPAKYSILFPVIIGLIIVYMLYRAAILFHTNDLNKKE